MTPAIETLRAALLDIAKAARLAVALSDADDAAPWRMVEERARQALLTIPAQDAGWRLVPIEPTEAMIDAGTQRHAPPGTAPFTAARQIWSAMLLAAPETSS